MPKDLITELWLAGYKLENIPNNPESNKKALIVEGKSDYNPEAFLVTNITLMGAILRKRGFDVNVLYEKACSRKNIESALSGWSGKDNIEKALFFFCGHGSNEEKEKKGISIGNSKDDLEPKELYEMLSQSEAKKGVILCSCNSGRFVDYLKDNPESLKNYVAISACPSDKVSTHDIIKDVGHYSRLIYAVYKLHKKHPGRQIDLSTAEIKTENWLSRIKKRIKEYENPAWKDVSYVMQRISDTSFHI